jgi:glucose/arabinose dehydrogenase
MGILTGLRAATFVAAASAYQLPWDAAFAPTAVGSHDMLYTEKCEGLSVIASDGREAKLMDSRTDPDYFCLGQSGMHGVVVDPDYGLEGSPHARDIYVYFASSPTPNVRPTNRVSRLTLAANITDPPVARVDIMTDIIFKEVANEAGAAGSHSGGRLRFGLKGTQYEDVLFVTSGDNHNATLPQDLYGLGSKVFAIDREGAPFSGNAISPPTGDARIFTYGLRNVQGLAMRPGTDQIYIAEHGPNHSDEVTMLVNGGNGGWDPKDRPNLDCQGDYCGYRGNPTTMPMTDFGRFPDAIAPVWDLDGRSAGMTPCIFLEGEQWGRFEGWLAVGIMGGFGFNAGDQSIVLLEIDAEGRFLDVVYPSIPRGRYRGLVMAPSGNLLVVEQERTGGGDIFEMTPEVLLNGL